MPMVAAEIRVTVQNLFAAFEGESPRRQTMKDSTGQPACFAPRAGPSRFTPPTMRA
jgi:hypothetical protein